MQAKQLDTEYLNQHDQRKHIEKINYMKNIAEIADASEKLSNGRAKRKMEWVQYKDSVKKEAYDKINLDAVNAANQRIQEIMNILVQMKVPPNNCKQIIENLELPRVIKGKLESKSAGNINYAYSLLITGVKKINWYDPFQAHFIDTDGEMNELPSGFDGFTCKGKQLLYNVWLIDVKQGDPKAVKWAYKREYLNYWNCCKRLGCEVA